MRTPGSGLGLHFARLLGGAAAAAVLALAGCASFPSPSSNNDSLFIFLAENPSPRAGADRGPTAIRFSGPSSMSLPVGGEERRVYYARIKAGHYSLVDPAAVGVDPAKAGFDVPPAAVFLYPYKLTRVQESPLMRQRALAALSPDDQRAASEQLTDWLDYEKWFGREVLGFGPYPPRVGSPEEKVEFAVSSTPAGATVTIDDQPWGVTPVTTHLPPGKHLLQLEIPGVALTKTFVDVEGKGEIDVKLPVLAAKEAEQVKARSDRIALLLTAFQNMGSADSANLSRAFPQVIASDLAGDERLSLVDAGDLVARGDGIPGRPDFALANQRGIDLIVSGYYTARADGLLVYAALYDVRTEDVRTSIIYTGKAGLAMFDSIDAMAAEFIKGIDRVLPEVRAPSLEQGGTVQSRVVTYEKRRSQTFIIDKRQARRSLLTFITGPNISAVGNVYQPAGAGALLAITPPGIIYGYSLGGPVSLTATLQPAIAFGPGSQTGVDYTTTPYLDIPLSIGPEYTVSGYAVDVSFGLLAEGRYTSAFFDAGSGGKVRQEKLSGAISLEMSARWYLQSRISETPTFIYLGFRWFLIGGQVDANFSNPQATPLELALNVGYGFRL